MMLCNRVLPARKKVPSALASNEQFSLQCLLTVGLEYALSRCEAMSSTYRFTETYDRITQTHRDTATFRSSSLLLNALALNFVILQLIGDASPEKLARFIEEIATADTDTGCAVLDQLHSGFGSHADLKYNRINFYLQIITSTSFGPVKTVAIASLAEELEALYDSISQLPEEIDVSKIRPALVAVLEVTDQISDRTMANAAVSLQGALLPFSIQSPGDLTSNPEVIANLYILAKNLTFAIRDETVSCPMAHAAFQIPLALVSIWFLIRCF